MALAAAGLAAPPQRRRRPEADFDRFSANFRPLSGPLCGALLLHDSQNLPDKCRGYCGSVRGVGVLQLYLLHEVCIRI